VEPDRRDLIHKYTALGFVTLAGNLKITAAATSWGENQKKLRASEGGVNVMDALDVPGRPPACSHRGCWFLMGPNGLALWAMHSETVSHPVTEVTGSVGFGSNEKTLLLLRQKDKHPLTLSSLL
jgi:hypothetical protein